METIELDYHDEILIIEYSITEGEKEVTFCGDGSGHPGVKDAIDIDSVVDMYGNDKIDNYDLSDLEEIIFEQM